MRSLLFVLPLLAGLLLFPDTATATPPKTIVQTNQGSSVGATFTASLARSPKAGNSIVIVTGLDNASTVGVLEPDDVANVIDASESVAAWQVPGAPYAIVWVAKADPAVRTWGFHGVAQPHTWLVAEVAGLQTFQPSGVPIWDGPASHSSVEVGTGGTTQGTGTGSPTAVPREVMIASFVARVPSGSPPTVTGFTNSWPQEGTWSRLGTSVATAGGGANHRLDVAFKVVTTSGSYACDATYTAAPSGMAALLTGLYAV